MFCTTTDFCDFIDDINKKGFQLTNALFWGLAVAMLLLYCVPTSLGCVWGWQLTKHPMIAEGALADSPYLNAQVGGK